MTSITIDSPVGPLEIAADDGGTAITHVLFHDGPLVDTPDEELPEVLVEAKRQLEAYFAGDLKDFSLPLAATGTDFQRRVWSELEEIPYGTTASYGEVAKALGMPPGASRAVGLANGSNPIAIVVPCHRVIGANGSLTGYAGGLERKKYLLDLEARDRVDAQLDLFASTPQ
jgi:methylated-DNA-[protein]-cysteine S-methyltransferase